MGLTFSTIGVRCVLPLQGTKISIDALGLATVSLWVTMVSGNELKSILQRLSWGYMLGMRFSCVQSWSLKSGPLTDNEQTTKS